MEKKYQNKVDIFNFLRVFALFCIIGIHSKLVIELFVPYMQNQFSVFVYTPAWTEIGIFFILSGYLLGKGFYKNKYTTDIKGMLSFWLTRLIRVFPMYFLLLFISFLFICPEFFFSEKWKILIPLFTFTFSGECSHFSFGATWFISTIMQLYFAMPVVFAIIKKWFIKYDKLLFFVVIIAGLLWRMYALHAHLDWKTNVYLPSWVNADYFFAGMLLNSFTQNSPDNKIKKYLRPLSILALFGLTAHLMNLYYHEHYTFYQYYSQTCMILVISAIVWSFDFSGKTYSSPLTLKNVVKNPLRIIDYLSMISFGMYLYHSYFLSIMPRMITNPAIFPEHISNGRLFCYTYTSTFIFLLVWCSILYFFIEKPSNQFRHGLFDNKETK